MIRIRGARQHNLKGIDVDLPRGKLVVVTGVSGSGKSSLAFHTLYAEGQRRYVESLSTYARQFLDQLEKPEVDAIEGLSPAIAIEQRSGGGNPRSTIATTTEIHDFLRILYAGAGVPHDPETRQRLERATSGEIVASLMGRPEGTKVILLAPLAVTGSLGELAGDLQRQGFVGVRAGGEVMELEEFLKRYGVGGDLEEAVVKAVEVVVDRLVVKAGGESRLADSVEVAMRICGAEVRALVMERGAEEWEELSFATSYRNAETGFVLGELSPRHFSFNAHAGACEQCHGLGREAFCDPKLVVPDENRTLAGEAVVLWTKGTKKKKGWNQLQIEALARHMGVSLELPFRDLPEAFKEALFFGLQGEKVEVRWEKDGREIPWDKEFEGVCRQVERLWRETESEGVKRSMGKFMRQRRCGACGGRRLKREYLAVKLFGAEEKGLGIAEFCELSIGEARGWLEGLQVAEEGRSAALAGVVREVGRRLAFLEEVGLGYLNLDRSSGSLSGGEFQRVRLATQLGAGLAGVLYVLDEPSIGLHAADVGRLIAALKRLRDAGNTVVVVEHDEEMVRAADWLIEIGPGAGSHGGELVAVGRPEDFQGVDSATGRWLFGKTEKLKNAKTKAGDEGGQRAGSPLHGGEGQRAGSTQRAFHPLHVLRVVGARAHNLQGVTVEVPLGRMVCVTGPSGSGKSTLVDGILRRALARRFHGAKEEPGAHERIEGMDLIDKVVVVDQSPLGRNPRSNPATYTGAFDLVRELFAKLPLSRQRGYRSGRFSFNVKGGRCEKCQGGGAIKIDMHFLPDAFVRCEACGGRRYNRETLEVRYRGKSVAEVLEMTVEEGRKFFEAVPKLHAIMVALDEVGLGYVQLGQAANTLSGGEAQRVKLACELAKPAREHTFYLLDEPTTGLHYEDVRVLLGVLRRLVEAGHSLLVVEHNLDVVRAADWVIDLGPGGGSEGGRVVAVGSPEELARDGNSVTGRYLGVKNED
ncbi:MAG: excinuclease ABC subunit UvrA [Verrucomicrobiales bacterium]